MTESGTSLPASTAPRQAQHSRHPRPSKAIAKYLRDIAVPQVDGSFGHVVVIPSFGEGEVVLDSVRSVPDGPLGSTLKIIVLNAAAGAEPKKHHDNEVSRDALFRLRDRSVLILDHAREGHYLPEGQGVGLARKLGADAALSLIHNGKVASSWICSTDADARLPSDYFHRLAEPAELASTFGGTGSQSLGRAERTAHRGKGCRPAAALFPFAHEPDPDPKAHQAIVLYECFLRYQRLSLDAAGSPYGFHSVGSTIAVTDRAYAEVRGFPLRTAGEDFYFLNKLAKTGSVHVLGGEPIRLLGRCSDRVPFGTGRAMLAFRREGWDPDSYLVPAPEPFRYLRCWLACLDSMIREREWSRDRLVADLRYRAKPDSDAERLLRVLNDLQAIDEISKFGSLGLSKPDLRRRVHGWFDAFRTLKFLHRLRDEAYPDLPFRDVISRTEWGDELSEPHELEGRRGLEGPEGRRGLEGHGGPEGRRGLEGHGGPEGRRGLEGPEGPEGHVGLEGLEGLHRLLARLIRAEECSRSVYADACGAEPTLWSPTR